MHFIRARGDRDRRDRDIDRRDERSDRDRRDDRRSDDRENMISLTSNSSHSNSNNQVNASSNPTTNNTGLGPPMEPSPGVWGMGIGLYIKNNFLTKKINLSLIKYYF